MPYAQLDDRYHDTKKVRRVLKIEPAAIAIHVMAITYCNQHNTDGEIESDRIDGWIALMPYKPARKLRLLTTLIEERLLEWRHDGETYVVHDYLDWNRSAAKRLELAAQGRRGGLAKAKANAKPGPKPTPSPGSSPGYSEGQSQGSSTPRHATPRQEPATQAARKRATRRVDQAKLPDDFPADLAAVVEAVLLILHRCWDERGGVEPGRRGVALAVLRNPRTDHEQLARRLEHWLTSGRGRTVRCADIASRFGDWVEGEDAAPRLVANGDAMSELDRKRLASATRLAGGAA